MNNANNAISQSWAALNTKIRLIRPKVSEYVDQTLVVSSYAVKHAAHFILRGIKMMQYPINFFLFMPLLIIQMQASFDTSRLEVVCLVRRPKWSVMVESERAKLSCCQRST